MAEWWENVPAQITQFTTLPGILDVVADEATYKKGLACRRQLLDDVFPESEDDDSCVFRAACGGSGDAEYQISIRFHAERKYPEAACTCPLKNGR